MLKLLALVGISPDKITFTYEAGLNIETEPAATIATVVPTSTEPSRPQDTPAETVNAGKLVIDFEETKFAPIRCMVERGFV